MQIQITGCMFENMGRNMNTKSKVIVLPCEAYDEERIYTLMKNGLAQLGGLDNLINKEEKILLKPNLLKKAKWRKRSSRIRLWWVPLPGFYMRKVIRILCLRIPVVTGLRNR